MVSYKNNSVATLCCTAKDTENNLHFFKKHLFLYHPGAALHMLWSICETMLHNERRKKNNVIWQEASNYVGVNFCSIINIFYKQFHNSTDENQVKWKTRFVWAVIIGLKGGTTETHASRLFPKESKRRRFNMVVPFLSWASAWPINGKSSEKNEKLLAK